jgi:prepilin-type N-terminal cleavage/methylation domain-containing protein
MRKILNKKSKAFSLIELSIVILIIGIIIASIIGGKKLVTLSNFSKARTLTSSSAVAGIDNLELWLETTSKDSFLTGQNIDGTEILTWRDINPQNNNKRDATGITTTSPIYTESAMNGLPVLRFNGSNQFLTFTVSSLIGGDFTVFIIEQRRSTASNNYIIGSTGATYPLLVGYSTSTFYENTVGGISHSSVVTAYSTPIPRIRTLTYTYSTANIIARVNGTQTDSFSPLGSFNAYSTPAIGRNISNYFNGDVGEIIMYSRALSDFERDEVEKYLSKKWGIKLS